MSALCALYTHRFKEKSGHGCAETVDASDSLWMLVENQDSLFETLCAIAFMREYRLGFYLTLPPSGNGA
jgi:hypothetical protein